MKPALRLYDLLRFVLKPLVGRILMLLYVLSKRYGVPHPYPLGFRWALFAPGIFLG